MARVLGVLRLSRSTDESTSIDRQRASIQSWAERNQHTIAGWAEDVDVSGDVAPWKRDDLGKWLPSTIGKEVSEEEERLAFAQSRAGEWDIIASWKLDRISRRVVHVHQLAEWAKANGKTIASVEDSIDLSTPMGLALFSLIAAFAQGELEAIRFRARSSFEHLVKTGRHRGGNTPYGYRAVKAEDGKGWVLVPDDYGTNTAGTLREIVRRILDDGESINAVCRWLNQDLAATPTAMDAQRIRAGKESKGSVWRLGNLVNLLRSETLIGRAYMTVTVKDANGKEAKEVRLVRDGSGMPLQKAEALLSPDEWSRLQAALDKRASKKGRDRRDSSPLLRIVSCECGRPMYLTSGRSRKYYRCSTRAITGTECGKTKAYPAPKLETLITTLFLNARGNEEIVRRRFVPGENHDAEIADVSRALQELRDDRSAGLYSGELGAEEFREQYRKLEGRRQELLALPNTSDRWEEEPTGETYAEMFARLSTVAERNKELREAGIKAVVYSEELSTQDARWDPEEQVITWSFGRVRITMPLPASLRERISKNDEPSAFLWSASRSALESRSVQEFMQQAQEIVSDRSE